MHIAVLDDKIADRKQLERLLDRESDRRIQTTGNLYIDTYGAKDAILAAPLKQYDFFMVDMMGPVTESLEIINNLRARDVSVPVCLMRNKEELKDIKDIPDNLLFIEKPIKVQELTDLIGSVIEEIKAKEEEEARIKQEQIEEYIKKNKGKIALKRIMNKLF